MLSEENRPRPADVTDEETLRRWYWLRSELVVIARTANVPTSGGKLELTERIAAHLAGRDLPAIRSTIRIDRLPAGLTGSTVIEPGQRCTQALRQWMQDHAEGPFTFNAVTRDAVAVGGITLDQLLAVWQESRHQQTTVIAPQFELNRFSRAWRTDHPGSTHADLLAAWRTHRSLPRD